MKEQIIRSIVGIVVYIGGIFLGTFFDTWWIVVAALVIAALFTYIVEMSRSGSRIDVFMSLFSVMYLVMLLSYFIPTLSALASLYVPYDEAFRYMFPIVIVTTVVFFLLGLLFLRWLYKCYLGTTRSTTLLLMILSAVALIINLRIGLTFFSQGFLDGLDFAIQILGGLAK